MKQARQLSLFMIKFSVPISPCHTCVLHLFQCTSDLFHFISFETLGRESSIRLRYQNQTEGNYRELVKLIDSLTSIREHQSEYEDNEAELKTRLEDLENELVTEREEKIELQEHANKLGNSLEVLNDLLLCFCLNNDATRSLSFPFIRHSLNWSHAMTYRIALNWAEFDYTPLKVNTDMTMPAVKTSCIRPGLIDLHVPDCLVCISV